MTATEIKRALPEDLIIRLSQLASVDKKWARDEERRIIKELAKLYHLDEGYMVAKIVEL